MPLTEVQQWIVLNSANVGVCGLGALLYLVLCLRAVRTRRRLGRLPHTKQSVLMISAFNAFWACGNALVSLFLGWLGFSLIQAALAEDPTTDIPDFVVAGTLRFLCCWLMWATVALGAYWYVEQIRRTAEAEAAQEA